MRIFNYKLSYKELLQPDIVKLVSEIHEYKGEQTLFIEAKEDTLSQLVEIAKIQSTESSNKIEGIYTSDERLKKIVQDKTRPKTRNEKEIAGYRDVLATIHENHDYIPLKTSDIKELEKILWSEVGSQLDYEAEFGKKPLGEFVREIVGLDMNAAKAAFAEYLDETWLDSNQIYFVNQIIEFIVHNGMMKDLSVLQEAPFTDRGSIVEIFTDVSIWMGIRNVIEQVNANAMAA